MGGDICVESEVGCGLEFFFVILLLFGKLLVFVVVLIFNVLVGCLCGWVLVVEDDCVN